MTNGLWKGSLLVLIIPLWKKDFRESTPKIQMLMFGLAKTSHFGLWDIIPPDSQLAFHIYYVKYENTLTCKRIILDSRGGGWCFNIIYKDGSILSKLKAVIHCDSHYHRQKSLNALTPCTAQRCTHMHICHTCRYSAYYAHTKSTPKKRIRCYNTVIIYRSNTHRSCKY